MLFGEKFLEDYFKLKLKRGFYLAFKSRPKPFYKAKKLITRKKILDHVKGRICLYLMPALKNMACWSVIDIDVLEKGKVLTLEHLNRVYPQHLYTLKYILKKVGLNDDEYLLVLSGRGCHLFIFYDVPMYLNDAFHFVNTIKQFFEYSLHKSTGVESRWELELRPSSINDKKKCIQLPGYNYVAERFSAPFEINNYGEAVALKKLLKIKKIEPSTVRYIAYEFKIDKKEVN